jgi:hypothetical protein
MSSVAYRAMALAPPGSNFEGLTNRLLALRAEIDAVLAELANQAMAMPRAEPIVSPTHRSEEPAAPAAEEAAPVLSDPLGDGKKSERQGWGMVEEAEAAFEPRAGERETRELLEPTETVSAAARAQPTADPVALEPIKAEPAEHDCAEPASEAPTQSTAIATGAVSAEQQGDTAMLDAPLQSSAMSHELEEHRQEPAAVVDSGLCVAVGPQAGDSPVAPAAGAGEAYAEATVISLQARQRKHKGGLATGAPMPARAGRHLAAKIAASILALLTAATVMVAADRTAFGGFLSLPWMSPTPSGPTGIDWLLQRLQSSDDAAAKPDLPLDDVPFAGRVGWGA